MTDRSNLDWAWVSKPWIEPARVKSVLDGSRSHEPMLVINSMSVPTLRVEHAVLAAGRVATLGPVAYEQIIHVLSGTANVRQRENGEEHEYVLQDDDAFFVPAGAEMVVTADDTAFMFLRCRGVSLDTRPLDGARPEWAQSVRLYGAELDPGLPPIAADYPITDVRLIKASERDEYPLGHRHSGPARVTQLERSVQYPNCGARTISSVISDSGPTPQTNNPHIQNFEEILYVARGSMTGAPETDELQIAADAGDLVFSPSKMAHYQSFPQGGKTIIFWGVYLVPWCPETMDGVWGHYHADGLLGRELPAS